MNKFARHLTPEAKADIMKKLTVRRHDKKALAREYGISIQRIYQPGYELKEQRNSAPLIKQPKTNVIVPPPVENRYDRLKIAQRGIDEALQQFIEEEVQERVAKVREENAHLSKTVERLQMECDKYQKAFMEAQNSNWVDVLKKKWSTSL